MTTCSPTTGVCIRLFGIRVVMGSGLAFGAPERRRSSLSFHVYMLASRTHGTLYLGVTNDLSRRVWEHKEKLTPGFTSRYEVDRLVWFEEYDRVVEAIAREKSLKKWRRDWKIRLIEADNPNWLDLYPLLNR